MKKGILVSAVILFASLSVVQAQEGELHGTIDFTFLSKYVWRGFDVYGDNSAIQPSIDLDLYGTGFGINIMAHRANTSGFETGERWDYTLYYHGKAFEDEVFATNYRLAYVYYNYPKLNSHTTSSIDLQEVHAVLSWPNLLPIKGLTPSYVLVKLWPSNSGTPVGAASPTGGTASGFAHIFMLDYGMPMEKLIPDTSDQVLHFHTELVYNDGVDPRGIGVDHDWSNIVFGVDTSFDLGNNLFFTPGVYHQVTMDKSVNPDKDETWVSLSLSYKF